MDNPLLMQIIGIVGGLGIGFVQKHLLPKLPNWLIPVVNPVVGAVVGHFVPGLGAQWGAMSGMASVGAHQIGTTTVQGLKAKIDPPPKPAP